MAILHSTGILIVDSPPSHEPVDQQATIARPNTSDHLDFYQWNGVEWLAFRPLDSGTFQREYLSVLTGANGVAPTDDVLKNTYGGALVWARTGEGVYTATANNAFTGTTVTNITLGSATGGIIIKAVKTSANVVTVSTFAIDGTTPADFIGTLNISIQTEV